MTRIAFALTFLMLLLSIPAFGQSRGALSGVVNDASGAAVPGAQITAKHIATGEEFKATTDAQGAFVLPSVPLGKFTVNVEASGFKRAQVLDVTVEIGMQAKITVPLEVGQVNEAVVISGETQEVINTLNPTLTNVINTKQVKDLPLNGRNPIDLARLQAGIAVSGDDTRNASVGGLRGSATNVTQDGINAMDNFVKTSSFFAISAPSLESTAEFSVTTGTVGSDAGRGVAQVKMVTKGGGNDYHGSLFYNILNDALNANTFFNNANHTPKAIVKQTYFGGTVGGAIRLPKKVFGPVGYDGRNKSFFFFSYEGFRQPQSVTRNRTVLTAAARQGLFSYTGANGQTQTVNLLTTSTRGFGLNPITTAVLNAMPQSNNTLVGDGFNTAGFQYNVSGINNNNKYVARYDQQLLENSRIGTHKLEFVFNRALFILKPDTFNGLEAPFPGGIDAFQSSSRSLATAAIQSTFGSNKTNEFRVGHQRAPVGFLRDDSRPTQPFFTNFASVTTFDNLFMSQGRNTMLYQYIDNFSLIKGTHTFRMGTDIQSVTALTFNDGGIEPRINIGSNTANGNGLVNASFPNLPSGATGNAIVTRAQAVYADLVGLLGNATQTFNVTSPTSKFVAGATNERDYKQRQVSLFFQDQWRVRRNFTFSYGMRYEFQGVPYETHGLVLQPTNDIAGLFGISGLNNLFKPGVRTGQATTTLDFFNGNTGRKLYNNDWNNFAPFIGIAYSPNFESGLLRHVFGSEGKSSIRAGYSISYLQDGFTVFSNAAGNPGLALASASSVPTGTLTAAGLPLAAPNYQVPTTDAANFGINNNNGLWTFDPNLRVPYVQQWSFGIEREIGNNTAIEVRYVANHAIKVYRGFDFNEVNIFENGFLNEFLNAQRNLTANGGTSFQPGAPGTVALPILSTLFNGLSSGSGFASSTFISNLNNNNVGAMAFTLANSPTYATTRQNLTFNGQPSPNFFLANPNASQSRLLSNSSFSTFNSLQAEIRRRLSKGLQLQANYTFSKALTDTDGGGQTTLESPRTLRDISLDKHRAGFDQTHRFISNFTYDLPFGTGRRWLNSGPGLIRKAVEGWTVGGILTWQSGAPLFISSGRSTFNQQNPGTVGAQFAGNTSLQTFLDKVGIFKTASGVFFFDPSILTITTSTTGPTAGQATQAKVIDGLLVAPAPGTFGNFPRNSINGPSFKQADFSVIKRTKITENTNVEFKATFFNAFNHPNFAFGGTNFDATNFGRITGTRGTSRNINFILKVNF